MGFGLSAPVETYGARTSTEITRANLVGNGLALRPVKYAQLYRWALMEENLRTRLVPNIANPKGLKPPFDPASAAPSPFPSISVMRQCYHQDPKIHSLLTSLVNNYHDIKFFVDRDARPAVGYSTRTGDKSRLKFQKLLRLRSRGKQFDIWMFDKCHTWRVQHLAQNESSIHVNRRMSEFLKETGLYSDALLQEIRVGVKLLVTEYKYGASGISILFCFALSRLSSISYDQLIDLINALREEKSLLRLVAEKSEWLEECQALFDEIKGDAEHRPKNASELPKVAAQQSVSRAIGSCTFAVQESAGNTLCTFYNQSPPSNTLSSTIGQRQDVFYDQDTRSSTIVAQMPSRWPLDGSYEFSLSINAAPNPPSTSDVGSTSSTSPPFKLVRHLNTLYSPMVKYLERTPSKAIAGRSKLDVQLRTLLFRRGLALRYERATCDGWHCSINKFLDKEGIDRASSKTCQYGIKILSAEREFGAMGISALLVFIPSFVKMERGNVQIFVAEFRQQRGLSRLASEKSAWMDDCQRRYRESHSFNSAAHQAFQTTSGSGRAGASNSSNQPPELSSYRQWKCQDMADFGSSNFLDSFAQFPEVSSSCRPWGFTGSLGERESSANITHLSMQQPVVSSSCRPWGFTGLIGEPVSTFYASDSFMQLPEVSSSCRPWGFTGSMGEREPSANTTHLFMQLPEVSSSCHNWRFPSMSDFEEMEASTF
ncbi:hypothetical protein BDBG_06422 [Blastomyces gilchristii SLH14081]|uniref:Uncharacterized protein n=1 Tax=Blastomyces gilchristii (strain SLH14081) TaxID=559298 RepID=A0A179UW20_BLAGS|nr:uncharacterized protein BDBG_06422 [Blastomyces gilchristii SLH14081]OAT10602.1 hypothetical protein BDBG_06422 [Blastomyces gilchristii SLH14081]